MGKLGKNPLLDVYLCIHDQHRPGMVLLALAITVLAAITAVLALRRARHETGPKGYVWAALGGLALGTGGWAAHHVALLGYLTDASLRLEFAFILTSLLLVAWSAISATVLLIRLPTRGGLLAASLFYGGGIAVMHYTSMAAFDLPATMRWDPAYVAMSVVFAVSLSYPTFALALSESRRAAAGSVACFALLVLLTHMTGMTALEIIPASARPEGVLISAGALAGWVGISVLGLFSGALLVLLANRQGNSLQERRAQQFSALVKATSDYAICMFDREGRISQWNAGVQRLTGYSANEVIGMPLAGFYTHEECTAGFPERALEIARTVGVSTQHGRCRRRDGTSFWVHGTLEKIIDEQGRHLGYSLIMHDVTQYKRAQDLVAETTGRLDSALENMHEGLCLFDASERLVLSNRRFRELWDLRPTDCRPGTPLGKLIVRGFMNPDGPQAAPRHLWEYRQILEETRDEERCSPAVVELGENRIVSIANSPLPDGGWVTTCTDITEQRRSEARIEYMALHDVLTDLPNRTGFCIGLDEKIRQAHHSGAHLAVLALDLDRFKDINEAHGHAVGDSVLQAIAQRLIDVRREGETFARLDGDEFAAAKVYREPAELDEFVGRVLSCIDRPVQDVNQRFTVEASMGVAIYPEDGLHREALLNNADLAMYRAKCSMGETVCFFEPCMDETARQRRQIANDVRHAVEQGELTLLYQPQRSLRTGALSGYEALLRWNHPTRGMVPPDEFIPIAEETGAILDIGEWVLREACKEARHWPAEQKVAVNISPVQFLQQDLIERVRAIVVETGLSPLRLELEITETAIISDKLRALHCLRQFKAMGVSIAIDDFGTGYSSLDTLHSFPFDKIKIDKSFLAQAENSSQACAIIRAVLALGKSLEIPVLAEGVENANQMRLLKKEGCDQAQGYYLGRPALAPSLALREAASF